MQTVEIYRGKQVGKLEIEMSQREVDRLLTCAIPGHPYALSRGNGRASSRTGRNEDYSRASEAASLSPSYDSANSARSRRTANRLLTKGRSLAHP